MRQIKDYFDDIPPRMREQKYLQLLKELLAKKGRGEIIDSSKDIKGYAPKEVKNKLILIFGNKCAFCECNTSFGAHCDTEHFRPKSFYYWLAFEWTNFLLSCQVCNRDYKKSIFDILHGNNKAILPNVDFGDVESIEAFFKSCHIRELEKVEGGGRVLLHPVLDNPNEHLEFQKNGRVVPKNGSIKGKNSIEVYGLDDWEYEKDKKGKNGKRKDLITERKKIIDQVEGELEHAMTHYRDDDRLYQDIRNINVKLIREIKNNEPFSAVRRTCLEKFKPFFIDNVPFSASDKEKLNKAYERLRKELNG